MRQLKNYTVDSLLARGTYGDMLAAHDARGRKFAIKRIPKHLMTDQRMKKEIKANEILSSENMSPSNNKEVSSCTGSERHLHLPSVSSTEYTSFHEQNDDPHPEPTVEDVQLHRAVCPPKTGINNTDTLRNNNNVGIDFAANVSFVERSRRNTIASLHPPNSSIIDNNKDITNNNIVKMYEHFSDSYYEYLVFHYIHGMNLVSQ